MILSALVFGIFGAIIGSFLNVLVLRRGVKTLGGRSACRSCGHELAAVDLVPVISYIALRGRCRFCGSRISIQYPLVESSTAVFFAFIGGAPVPLSLQLLALPVAALLVAISAYDILHTIIPDEWVYLLAGCSLLWMIAYLSAANALSEFTLYIIAGPVSALPFAALWYVSNGSWMGLGDAKLAWGVGWLLGPLYGFLAIAYAFILGAIVSVFILLPLSSKRVRSAFAAITHTGRSHKAALGFTMKSEVAFGPFLAAACALVWLSVLYHLDPTLALVPGSPL